MNLLTAAGDNSPAGATTNLADFLFFPCRSVVRQVGISPGDVANADLVEQGAKRPSDNVPLAANWKYHDAASALHVPVLLEQESIRSCGRRSAVGVDGCLWRNGG